MKISIRALVALGLLAVCGAVNAQSASEGAPRSGFFAGVGGSYNVTTPINQNAFAQGVSNVYQNGTLVAFGSAGGNANLLIDSQATYAPVVQAGYFDHFADSAWVWGAKFSYSYLNANPTKQNLLIPQAGSFTSSNSSSFTGNVLVRSYEVSVDHQIVLTPFLGRTIDRSFVYLGAGPSLSRTQTAMKGVIGFADINGTHADITGTPSDFSSSQWSVGAAAVAGVSYFLDRSWFMDFSYSFSMMQTPTSTFSGPFTGNTSGTVTTGLLSGYYSGRMLMQSFKVTLNKAF